MAEIDDPEMRSPIDETWTFVLTARSDRISPIRCRGPSKRPKTSVLGKSDTDSLSTSRNCHVLTRLRSLSSSRRESVPHGKTKSRDPLEVTSRDRQQWYY